MFVILPLFYLNGDANFRVLHQGLWKALKKELFQTNREIGLGSALGSLANTIREISQP